MHLRNPLCHIKYCCIIHLLSVCITKCILSQEVTEGNIRNLNWISNLLFVWSLLNGSFDWLRSKPHWYSWLLSAIDNHDPCRCSIISSPSNQIPAMHCTSFGRLFYSLQFHRNIAYMLDILFISGRCQHTQYTWDFATNLKFNLFEHMVTMYILASCCVNSYDFSSSMLIWSVMPVACLHPFL